MKKLLFLPLLLILISACTKDEVDPTETKTYLVFGHYYGMCGGETCVETYKLDDQLHEDTKDEYPGRDKAYAGNYTKRLSQQQYIQVKDLLTSFPDSLFNETALVIGQPDAGDWGGFYIETNLKGKKQFWFIDKKRSNVPTYLHPFLDEVEAKIELLQ